MLVLALGIFFTVAVQDTVPAVLPDSLPVPVRQDTVPPVLPDSLPAAAEQDTLPPVEPDSLSIPEFPNAENVIDTVYVWKNRKPAGFATGDTDSTLRWKHLVNFVDRFYRQPGAITARQGTVGRLDAMELHAFENRHIELEMEGLLLNQPLTGQVDWNRLAVHKLREYNEQEFGAIYRGQARLRDHYLVNPRTYLNFDESKFNYRSLEFSATHNLTQKTNLELSFWDRRDGGGYARSSVEGRQIVAKAYHQLSEKWMLKSGYVNNGMDRQESFGYVFPGEDPILFSFNRFIAVPNQTSAASNQTSSDAYVQVHRRGSNQKPVSTELGLHYQTDRWSITYPADTVSTHFKQGEFYARQHLGFGGTSITATGRVFSLAEVERQNLSENQWMGSRADLDLTQKLTGWSRIYGHAHIRVFDDSRTTTELSGSLELQPIGNSTLRFFGGVLSRAPDIQSSYWQSESFSGDQSLLNEETVAMGAMVDLKLGSHLGIGARIDIRDTEQGHFVADSSFVNLAPYTQQSGTAWIEFDSKHIEGQVSATVKQFISSGTTVAGERLNNSGDRTWFKGVLYWKSYLFDRATYVTTGFSGMVSPNAFRTAEFYPQLNRWQHGMNEYINPSYYRLDFDLSARIRWFMLLIKWENILDRVEQAGYFESTGYPMPERRFTMGFRILFTN